MKKLSKIFSNLLLVGIVLILIIPSWRFQFQVTFQKLFMGNANFELQAPKTVNKDFALFDINDKMTSFAELKGKPAVLAFWRTWCVPCRAELPQLLKLKENFGGKLNVFALTNETFEVIDKAKVDKSLLPLIRYAPHPSSSFEVEAFPTLFLLNEDLKILSKITGGGKLLNEANKRLINSLFLKDQF